MEIIRNQISDEKPSDALGTSITCLIFVAIFTLLFMGFGYQPLLKEYQEYRAEKHEQKLQQMYRNIDTIFNKYPTP